MGGARSKVGTFAAMVLAAGLLALAPGAPAGADASDAPGAPEAFRSLSAGQNHTCLLDPTGILRCWGHNGSGQLGQGDDLTRGDDPGEVSALAGIDLGTGRRATAVSAGQSHTCAVLDNGQVKCWGRGDSGRLGYGDTAHLGDDPNEMGDNLPAVDLGAGRTATAVVASEQHSCALLDNGQVKCWGRNLAGQLGLGDTAGRGDEPNEMGDTLLAADLGTGRTATAIGARGMSTCALLDNGQIKCWGRNSSGQLGLGDTADRGDEPNEMGDTLLAADLGTGRTATAMSVGREFVCAILDNGDLKCWGDNFAGMLGRGDTADRGNEPGEMGDALPAVALGTGRNAVGVAADHDHACALLDDDSVKCWGDNAQGALGLGDTDDRGNDPNEMGDNLPTVDIGGPALAVTTSEYYSCALLANLTVKCWGGNSINSEGALGLGDTENRGDGPGEMGSNLPAVDLPPPNDDFADATVLTGPFGTARGSNANAANEPGEDLHDSRALSDVTVWWNWTAPASGAIEFNTAGSTADTILAVYTGSAVNALTVVTSNDDTNSSVQSEVEFAATAGTTYRIVVAGFGPTGSGPIRLNWLPNDDLADAALISGATGTASGGNFGASLETDEPDHNPTASGDIASIWYRWTPTTGGRVTFDTVGSSFDTVLAVYTGSSLNALSQVAANDDSVGLQSKVVFTATAGTTYRIALAAFDGANPAFGATTLHWTQAAPCDGRPVTVALAFGDTPTAGVDVIRGTNGNNTINGLAGADRICGGNGTDTLRGGTGSAADRLFGENGTDTLRGGSGNDRLDGGAQNDSLFGEAGNDTLNGGANRDTCNGGTQPDTQTGCEVRTSIP